MNTAVLLHRIHMPAYSELASGPIWLRRKIRTTETTKKKTRRKRIGGGGAAHNMTREI